MSDAAQATQATETVTDAQPVAGANAMSKPALELALRYSKGQKIVLFPGDDQDAFSEFHGSFEEGALQDWTSQAPGTFTTLAIVPVDDEKTNRFVAIADRATAFADPTVANWLYNQYVNKVTNSAKDSEQIEASFITAAGCFKQKFSDDAFKKYARGILAILHEKGLTGITVRSLRDSLANQAAAASLFSKITPQQWEGVIGVMRAKAVAEELDVSLFDHWLATRNARPDDSKAVEFTLADLTAGLDAKLAPKPAEPAAATA